MDDPDSSDEEDNEKTPKQNEASDKEEKEKTPKPNETNGFL